MDILCGKPCNICKGEGEQYIAGVGMYLKCSSCQGTGIKKISKVRKIKVDDLGSGIFKDKKTGITYVWDLQDGVMGFLENQTTLEVNYVLEESRDKDDNVVSFTVETK